MSLIGKEFDVQAFLDSPKCRSMWKNVDTDAGCLWTAFFRGFGVELSIYGPSNELFVQLDELVEYHKIPNVFPIKFKSQLTGKEEVFNWSFCWKVIHLYDRGKPVEALKLIWLLIDKLPKKNNIGIEAKAIAEKQMCELVK